MHASWVAVIMGAEDQKDASSGVGSGGNAANNDSLGVIDNLSALLAYGNDLASQYLEKIVGSSSKAELFTFAAKLPELFLHLDGVTLHSDDQCLELMENFGQTMKSVRAVEAQMKEFLPDRTLQLRRSIEIQMFFRISMWNRGEDAWRTLENAWRAQEQMTKLRHCMEGERRQPSASKRMAQELKMLAQLCFTYIEPRKLRFKHWLKDVMTEAGSGQDLAMDVYEHSYEEASSFTSEDGIDDVSRDLLPQMDLEKGNGADGVQEQVSERNPIHPPGVPNSSSLNGTRKKRPPKSGNKRKKNNPNRSNKSAHIRANDKKAGNKAGGSRLIISKSTPAVPRGAGVPNNRTCLLDAILRYIGDTKRREEIKSSFLASMPEEGDTSISTANAILARHNFVIKRASERYNRGGSIAFHLLQRYSCSLIIHLRLYDLNDPTLFASHFVAWDGKEVHDFPKSVRVNNSTDRSTEARCNDVFERLYHKKKFSRWHITSVYELRAYI